TPPATTPTPSRRAVLGGGAAALLAAIGLSTVDVSAYANPAGPGAADQPVRFAFFTDPHADPENAAQQARLRATLQAIAADDPTLVLHAGDVTEYGTDAEYLSYLELVPAGLRDRIHHVPGNHEIRWDVTAYENYTEHIDELNVEVTAGGVQFLLLDPTIVQQEVGFYSEADLTWLRERLAAKPAHRPTVVVTHYPMAQGHYYVVNPEDLLAELEGHNVRAVLAGHTHRQMLEHFNGMAHLEGAAVKNQAQYYRLTLGAGPETVLTIEHVAIPDPERPDQQTVTPVTEVDFGGQSGRNPLDPRTLRARVHRGRLDLTVGTRQLPATATARAGIYQQALYAGRADETWTALERRGQRFFGELDVSGLVPGEHRANVEVVDGDQRWREVVAFTVPGDAAAPVWDRDLGGILTGATAQLGSLVFAASSAGRLSAVDPSRGRVVWEVSTSRVHTNLAVGADLVVAGSADGTVPAVRPTDGSVAWRTDLGHPVMSDPLVATIAGADAVVVMTGDRLVRLDAATGEVVWESTMPGVSAGRAAADDERIYLGLGDGKAWAVDAATGELQWERELANRDGSYRRLIYGPWTHQTTLITDSLVFVSTVAGGRALDRASGEIVWQIDKSFLYTPVRILDDGDLLLVDEWGEARRVDAATGETHWLTDRMVSRSLDAGPVVAGSTAYVVGTMGDLAVLDLADGSYERVRQLSVSPVVSSPSLVDGVLVVGHLDGTLRGYRV
ncbi:outer membrane protein assembly factor BamB family protein, partial [Parenemella sanctibonifatiensis]